MLILADDLGYSDLGCYGSEIQTPNLDRLASSGIRFTQFYNAARCCPTRASLLTGLFPHQAGVGHMLGNWKPPAYTDGLNDRNATIAELLRDAGYRTYQVGKWHVGGVGGPRPGRNFPLDRGFDHFYGTGGGGSYFAPRPLFLEREPVVPSEPDYYLTDALSKNAVRYLKDHRRTQSGRPFFIHLCYTAPHFPLHAKPEDVARYRGKYRRGWDVLREQRFARQKELGIVDAGWELSPRDPVSTPWSEVTEKDEWDLRMAVHAAMVDSMDQGIGQVIEAVREMGAERNTLVIFLSDNGASAEALDSWPNPVRGHKPGAVVGTPDSHRCMEVGWANAANTPFREHKMWAHEGGIATPLIAHWPAGISNRGKLNRSAGHVIDLMPTLLDVAGTRYPKTYAGRTLLPLEGRSLTPAFRGRGWHDRELAWEHEGNRAIRREKWKLVAAHQRDWELYRMDRDRTETRDLARKHPGKVKELSSAWQNWADRVGVVPWDQLPGAGYKPAPGYRKKSEPVEPTGE